LGSGLGPNIDLTLTVVAGSGGAFVLGGAGSSGAVPETSTWAMMLTGLAGLGFVGYKTSREARRAV
jgi:hypothetical protein